MYKEPFVDQFRRIVFCGLGNSPRISYHSPGHITTLLNKTPGPPVTMKFLSALALLAGSAAALPQAPIPYAWEATEFKAACKAGPDCR